MGAIDKPFLRFIWKKFFQSASKSAGLFSILQLELKGIVTSEFKLVGKTRSHTMRTTAPFITVSSSSAFSSECVEKICAAAFKFTFKAHKKSLSF